MEQIALFVDIENVIGFSEELDLPIDLDPIVKKLTESGTITVRRSFGDINQSTKDNRMTHFVRQMLQRNGVQHEDIPFEGRKNSADMRLAVEAIWIAFTYPNITKFAIISNDRDYFPLFQKLRELGRQVIGIVGSENQIRPTYKNFCDAIIYFDELNNDNDNSGEPTAKNKPVSEVNLAHLRNEYCDLLIRAVNLRQKDGTNTVGGSLTPLMRQLQPDFDLSRAGFLSFRDFAYYAERRSLIKTSPAGGDISVVLASEYETAQEEIHRSNAGANQTDSVEYYRAFVEDRLKCPLPAKKLRQIIYDVANKQIEYGAIDGVRLDDLSHDVTSEIVQGGILKEFEEAGISNVQSVVYKLLNTISRANTFEVEFNRYSNYPQIVGAKISVDKWDGEFVSHLIQQMQGRIKINNQTLKSLFYEN